MNRADRKLRDALILRLHAQQVPKVEIARQVGVNPMRVRTILAAHGIAARPINQDGRVPQGQWDDENTDRLRRAIWKRQREGAKAALQAMIERHDG